MLSVSTQTKREVQINLLEVGECTSPGIAEIVNLGFRADSSDTFAQTWRRLHDSSPYERTQVKRTPCV